jgi:hypothetical protein
MAKFEITGPPTWRNTLDINTVNQNQLRFMHIGDFAMAAFNINYPYISWNGRVYAILSDDYGDLTWRDTNLFEEDILS